MATDSHSDLAQFYVFLGDLVKQGTKLKPEEIIKMWRDMHPREPREAPRPTQQSP